jgi:hypothetical protein
MRADVKPLTHWLIYRGYSVRFSRRRPESVQGVIATPEGELAFDYEPQSMTIHLPDRTVVINQYGWEIDRGQPEQDDLS